MIIGLISDAHGNVYGLKKCIDSLEKAKAEKIYFLGDAVNYFSKGKEVLEVLRANKKIKCIKGNHEMMFLESRNIPSREKEIYNSDLTSGTLAKEDYEYIKSWEDSMELEFGDFKALLIHGSPFDTFDGYVYPDSNFDSFRDLEYDAIFMAHTHIPFIKNIGRKTIVNIGSAGFSRKDGSVINCALFDVEQRKATVFEEKFPVEELENLKPFHQDLYKVLERRPNKEKVLNEA